MLSKLHIRNYALIDNLDISFSKELNILTGETGAGKSIILGALSLILGQRAEGKYFFNQQKKCVIEGLFQVEGYNLSTFFSENDIDYDKEAILRREISADGKSRAFINDSPVNLATLKQLGEKLIDIHSQHATLDINNDAFQLTVVDTIANHPQILSSYRETYISYRLALSKYKKLISDENQIKADLSYYQFLFDELEKADIKEDEQMHLEQELDALTHAEEIKKGLINATYTLSGNEFAIVKLLKDAISQLQQIEKYYPDINSLSERLNVCMIEIKDVASEIEQLEKHTNYNESRSIEIGERLDIIYALQKKHRVNSNQDLIAICKGLSEKLNEILFAEEDLQKLKIEINNLTSELILLANQLSNNRNQIIPKLENQIKESLIEVGMPNAILKIENEVQIDEKLTENGKDQIRFMFSANKGQTPLLLNKVASGGELSRLMLCIKSLIAKHTALPTIIFDEIDTGISGEIASKVGNIMEKLSLNMQVIAITHLPQIASKGKAHYSVYKDDSLENVQTNIKKLDNVDRTMEIAKMLSGENPGEFALQNAKELLKF